MDLKRGLLGEAVLDGVEVEEINLIQWMIVPEFPQHDGDGKHSQLLFGVRAVLVLAVLLDCVLPTLRVVDVVHTHSQLPGKVLHNRVIILV